MIPETIFQDDHFIAINKPGGMPVQPDKTGDLSVLDLAEGHNQGKGYFLIHRLDRPASGLIILGKNKKSAAAFSALFKSGQLEKNYLAAVRKKPSPEAGELNHYLLKATHSNKVHTYEEKVENSVEGRLQYKLSGRSDHYFFLEIKLLTGRQHQIRAQLAAIGCPVKGDVKYGDRRKNADRSIHLHARSLKFIHPFNSDEIFLKANLPEDPVWKVWEKQNPDI